MNDPMPLSARQIWALACASTRELAWGLRAASHEIAGWRERAFRIPDPSLREDALHALACKRTHIVGAALFSTLPRRRNLHLLRLLVAYEVTLEFLDNVHERSAYAANGRQLHRALLEALDPSVGISDYYRFHPCQHDGGYLRALVEACRDGCLSLPSYAGVRPLVLNAADRCGDAQSSSHVAARLNDAAALRRWAESEQPGERETSWWERSAAASSSVGVHALLALAACPLREDYAQVSAAYDPWICAVSTMLDSYIDQTTDLAAGQHSYLSYYPSGEEAVSRVCELVERSAREAARLRDGQRHAVILACMVAMYLSSDRARTPAVREASRRIADAGGSLTRLLVPILRAWRLAYGQRGT
jgi:tetraprenyl-beta-curcumene synthase